MLPQPLHVVYEVTERELINVTSPTTPIQLGLIGDNIAQSRAPQLHENAGKLENIAISYDRLVPADLKMDYQQIFQMAQENGYRGLNITYPYKELVVPLVTIPDASVRRLGAVNTVVFNDHGPVAYNTDWSGFMAGYRNVLGETPAGRVCMVGAGGVGRAVAFGLLDLGLRELHIVDRDLPKAEALAASLLLADPKLSLTATDDLEPAARDVDGLVNCTPVGMVGYDGTPVPRDMMQGARWAFDAVYTPVNTQFLQDAEAEGLNTISGEELFFYQGLHAFSYFHNRAIEETVLRQAMALTVR